MGAEQRIPSDDLHDLRPSDLGSRPCVPTDGRAGNRIRRERGMRPVTDEGRYVTGVLIALLRSRLAECGVRAVEVAS
jgi:hypothetical protein